MVPKFRRRLAAFLVACLGAAASPLALALSSAPVKDELIVQGKHGYVNWSEGRVFATGNGAPPARGSAAQRRLMAERAGLSDAYRNLAEMIHGVSVTSETSVQGFVTQSDVIRTHVTALVKGAIVTHKRLTSDGAAEVEIGIPLYGQDSLMETMADQVLHKAQASSPLKPPLPQGEGWGEGVAHRQHTRFPPGEGWGEGWGEGVAFLPAFLIAFAGEPFTLAHVGATGLVVDARGLKLAPAMSPAILASDRRELYLGVVPVEPDVIINQGVVEYHTSLDTARKSPRVGASPLVVRAQRAGGRLQADVMLDEATSRTVLEADKTGRFLPRAAVVIVS